MLVCHCERVSDRTVRHLARSGAETVDQVGAMCRAGTGCGGCRPLVRAIVDEEHANSRAEDDSFVPLKDVG